MYILHRTFTFFEFMEEKMDSTEHLLVSKIVMSVEEQNTAVNKTMQMQKQIKTLLEKFDGLPDRMMEES